MSGIITHFFKHIFGWYRFIDDIFFCCSGGLDKLQAFNEYMNSRIPSIKFTLSHHETKISFLDVMVEKRDDKLITRMYRKETDKNNFLHYSSCHVPSLKANLPYSQFLRVRRICSEKEDFPKHAEDMYQRFVERGYSKSYFG